MLREIYCEQFHQKRIEFDKGLNVVLGTNTGDNSIGKSTLMLIIDFVFGGKKYSEETDILEKVGQHKICFKFEFGDKPFYFAKYNNKSDEVWECNEKYEQLHQITNTQYCQWLSEQYQINLFDLSFRDAVGRYIRVYGKENFDEHHPLHVVPTEKANKAIIALLKIFNKYKVISDLEDNSKEAEEAFKIFSKAQKLNFVSKINKSTYRKNIKDINNLQNELNRLSDSLEHGLADIDSTTSEKAIEIKRELSKAKRMRSSILSKLSDISDNADYKFSQTTDAYSELAKFFPGVNIRHIDEIESFHKKISEVFKDEITQEQKNLKHELQVVNNIVSDFENQLRDLINNPNLSKMILQKHSEALKAIDQKKKENEAYDRTCALKKSKLSAKETLLKVKSEQLGIVEKTLNSEMEAVNNKLYSVEVNAPTIHMGNDSYSFYTPYDKGTGTAYKGLIVFDLSIVRLTRLPILVHDSVVLKQISDIAIENILDQYISCGKQVIIALDKQDSYSKKAATILEEHAKIKLAPNGEELFGRSWSVKKK